MTAQLALLALGTLASEDLACITAGVLVARGELSLPAAVAACAFGIFGGDLLLVLAGRWLGAPLIRRWIAPARIEQAAVWLERRGWITLFISRFTPGLRLPLFVAAGVVGANLLRISFILLVATLAWTPLFVGLAAYLGEAVFRSSVQGALIPLAVSALLLIRVVRSLWQAGSLRIWWGRQRTLWQWEFWPAWIAYLPLIPNWLYLSIKHRSFTVFTAANPGIYGGGLMGESKSEILAQLDPDRVARFVLLPAAHSFAAREARARLFQEELKLAYPVVLKPDFGERGAGVAIIRTPEQMRRHLAEAKQDLILQEYIPGAEFGIFYARVPGAPRGRILSINAKSFPFVTGDGVSTVRELILRDRRAVCLAAAYLEALGGQAAAQVPAPGERVPIVEIGAHCRGAIFRDALHLLTPQLEAAIHRTSLTHSGFFIGRFDVRAHSPEALGQGDFRVIELNGVGGEAAHIYDPEVSLLAAYQSLFHTWGLAYAIGAENRKRGHQPLTLAEFAQLALWHFGLAGERTTAWKAAAPSLPRPNDQRGGTGRKGVSIPPTTGRSRPCRIRTPRLATNTATASANSSP